MLLWDFLLSEAVYDFIIYSDFVNVGTKLLNVETKGTNNGHAGDVVEHMGLFLPTQVTTHRPSSFVSDLSGINGHVDQYGM
jgi:hypothetical protein